jgi:hypothetical protein
MPAALAFAGEHAEQFNEVTERDAPRAAWAYRAVPRRCLATMGRSAVRVDNTK